MKCERCGAEGAEIHLVKIINGERHVEHLCAKCAKELLPLEDASKMLKMTFSIEGMMELQDVLKDLLLSDLSGYIDEKENIYEDKVTRDDLIEHFAKERASYYDAQNQHTMEEDPLRSLEYDELTDLKNELKLAIRDERYERAATIRDRIRELNNTSNTD